MAWTAPTTRATGDLITAAIWNSNITDNLLWIGGAAGRGTSLPSSPVDGHLYDYLADATNGIVWRFRYNAGSASSYKWEFIGGAPLFAIIDTQETAPITTYGDCATVGPSIVLPLAGDYDVTIGAQVYGSIGAAGKTAMSYAIGATAAAAADEIMSQSSVATDYHYLSRTKRKTGLTAVTLTAKYYYVTTVSQFANRTMMVLPVRVS